MNFLGVNGRIKSLERANNRSLFVVNVTRNWLSKPTIPLLLAQ